MKKTLGWAIEEMEQEINDAISDRDFWRVKMNDPLIYRDAQLLACIHKACRARGARAHAFFDALAILAKIDAQA